MPRHIAGRSNTLEHVENLRVGWHAWVKVSDLTQQVVPHDETLLRSDVETTDALLSNPWPRNLLGGRQISSVDTVGLSPPHIRCIIELTKKKHPEVTMPALLTPAAQK